MNKLNYQYNCVSPKSSRELEYIIENSRMIELKTFKSYVNKEDLKELEKGLGYAEHYKQGLLLSQDWSISYHKSTLKSGKPVYYMRQSHIEYIFY